MKSFTLKFSTLFVLLAAMCIASCGPNKEEQAEKARQDSIRVADSLAEVQRQDSLAEAQRIQDSIAAVRAADPIRKAYEDGIQTHSINSLLKIAQIKNIFKRDEAAMNTQGEGFYQDWHFAKSKDGRYYVVSEDFDCYLIAIYYDSEDMKLYVFSSIPTMDDYASDHLNIYSADGGEVPDHIRQLMLPKKKRYGDIEDVKKITSIVSNYGN